MSKRLLGGLRRGFTLVEIMIVILIIGMLLTIALPNFIRAREGANAKACQDNMRQIVTAKERWSMEKQMPASATPTFADLVGSDAYLLNQPVCPGGGTYAIGNLTTQPTCTIGGTVGEFNAHVLP